MLCCCPLPLKQFLHLWTHDRLSTCMLQPQPSPNVSVSLRICFCWSLLNLIRLKKIPIELSVMNVINIDGRLTIWKVQQIYSLLTTDGARGLGSPQWHFTTYPSVLLTEFLSEKKRRKTLKRRIFICETRKNTTNNFHNSGSSETMQKVPASILPRTKL